MSDNLLKVILCAGALPDDAKVTKRTGTTEYTLVRQVRFFPGKGVDKEERQTITPRDGCVFLVDDRGNVNIYPPTTEFVWHTDEEEFQWYLEKKNEGSHK